MVLPLFKVILVMFKMVSKPLSGGIKEFVRHNFTDRRLFIYLGNKANIFEIKINRKLINPNTSLDFIVKPLKDDAAFNRGVDFFVEITFLYGLVAALTLYEVRKSYISSGKSSARLKKIEDATINNERMVEELQILIKDNQKLVERISNSYDLKQEGKTSL